MLITRVQQLEMERKKIELRNASATIGTTNTFSRNSTTGNANPTSGPGATGQRKGG